MKTSFATKWFIGFVSEFRMEFAIEMDSSKLFYRVRIDDAEHTVLWLISSAHRVFFVGS